MKHITFIVLKPYCYLSEKRVIYFCTNHIPFIYIGTFIDKLENMQNMQNLSNCEMFCPYKVHSLNLQPVWRGVLCQCRPPRARKAAPRAPRHTWEVTPGKKPPKMPQNSHLNSV